MNSATEESMLQLSGLHCNVPYLSTFTGSCGSGFRMAAIWEFPKIRGTAFGGPYNKDPTI